VLAAPASRGLLLRTRFAPSPTGYLHLGHVVNAIYTWGVARRFGADVLLRLEDHDRNRCRPEYVRALLEDLDWLGFAADAGREPLLRQSESDDPYLGALTSLRRHFHVYACACSRKDLRERQGDDPDAQYDGYCRDRQVPEEPGTGLRVALADGDESWRDLRLGPMTQTPADQCGDLLLRDRDGNWTYQFAATVDDYRQRITLVIRGEDLLSSTGRQLRLARMLGRLEMPEYLHHPLIRKPSGDKLSKSSGDTGVRELRASGIAAPEVIGRAAYAAGLTTTPATISADEVATLFA
jgi:glutamyl-tRNA synthetase/glutamyl-Q tRNA(Asp) synthetase